MSDKTMYVCMQCKYFFFYLITENPLCPIATAAANNWVGKLG